MYNCLDLTKNSKMTLHIRYTYTYLYEASYYSTYSEIISIWKGHRKRKKSYLYSSIVDDLTKKSMYFYFHNPYWYNYSKQKIEIALKTRTWNRKIDAMTIRYCSKNSNLASKKLKTYIMILKVWENKH